MAYDATMTLAKALESVPESVKKALKEGNDAKEALVKAQETANAKVYLEKAESLKPFGEVKELGPRLQKIAGALGDDFEAFETKLTAVSKQADLGIATEIGSKGEGETDIQKLIKQDITKQMKEDPKLSKSAAMRLAMTRFSDKLGPKGE